MNKNIDVYTIIGAAVELNAVSKYHRQFPISYCMHMQIIPAIKHNQVQLYFSKEGKATGLVIWAWLSKEVMNLICSPNGKGIEADEWNCGTNLFFSDFIVPYGNIKTIFNNIFTQLFPKEKIGISIRRNLDGSFRKKNIWKRERFK